ncbi:MAG: carboxypeptidase regulatory-like domain-containing protein [Myxococcales bacterium FL481]|nr:MAG: carboxypeptidase regulatory-like domain-containing protein [Myxococcales bacterium FL481]
MSTRACPQPYDTPLANPQTTEAMRCDRMESPARNAVSVDGTVLGRVGEPGHPGEPLAGVTVSMHAIADDGSGRLAATLGRTMSDAQGHFRLSLRLKPGDYMVAARSELGDEVLSMVRVNLSPHGPRRIERVRLWVPVEAPSAAPAGGQP